MDLQVKITFLMLSNNAWIFSEYRYTSLVVEFVSDVMYAMHTSLPLLKCILIYLSDTVTAEL